MRSCWLYHRDRLSYKDRLAYDRIVKAAEKHNSHVDLSGTTSKERISEISNGVVEDHPLFFHFAGLSSYTFDRNGCVKEAQLKYYMGEKERQMFKHRIDFIINEVLSTLSDDDDVFDRERNILSWLTRTMRWSETGIDMYDHTLLGALILGKGVCDSISMAVSVLMNAADIDCTVVSENLHSWNLTRIHGTLGHVDAGVVDWNCPMMPSPIINISDQDMGRMQVGARGDTDYFRVKDLDAKDGESLIRILKKNRKDMHRGLQIRVWTSDADVLCPHLQVFFRNESENVSVSMSDHRIITIFKKKK